MSNFAGMAATKNSLGSFSERTAWWTAGPKRCSSASTASLHMHVLNEFEVGIASWRKFGQNVRKYQLLHWSATHSALQDCAPAASGISFNDSDGLFKCFIRYICFHMCWFDWLIYDSGFSCCRICGEFRLHFCAHQLCSWFLSQLIPLAVWRTSTLLGYGKLSGGCKSIWYVILVTIEETLKTHVGQVCFISTQRLKWKILRKRGCKVSFFHCMLFSFQPI